MPVTVTEKFESRSVSTGPGGSAELRYTIMGTDSDTTARALLESAAPPTFQALPLRGVRLEPAGPMLWDGEAFYGEQTESSSSPPETGESVFAFDTGGGAQHITQSLSTVGVFAPPGRTAPGFQGAIGVTADSVEGVDITVPVYQFTETHYLADAEVTPAYRGVLFSLTGKVNSDPFREFQAGEVLFLGASGSKRGASGGGGDWEITFRFAASPNRTGIVVGPITGISKKGWEYLWVRYEDAEDAAAQAIVKRPVGAYVERVYPEAAFAGLEV